jgi:hypothetical protein
MRYLRLLLWLVAIGAASCWFIGLAHRFNGFYCLKTDPTCTPQDLRFQGHVVLWLAPLVFFVSLALVRVFKHSGSRFQHSSARPPARRQPLAPQAARPAPPPAATGLSDGPGAAPRVSDQPVDPDVDRSPRHAARDHFITFYDQPGNARPRHAAPEPEPEW